MNRDTKTLRKSNSKRTKKHTKVTTHTSSASNSSNGSKKRTAKAKSPRNDVSDDGSTVSASSAPDSTTPPLSEFILPLSAISTREDGFESPSGSSNDNEHVAPPNVSRALLDTELDLLDDLLEAEIGPTPRSPSSMPTLPPPPPPPINIDDEVDAMLQIGEGEGEVAANQDHRANSPVDTILNEMSAEVPSRSKVESESLKSEDDANSPSAPSVTTSKYVISVLCFYRNGYRLPATYAPPSSAPVVDPSRIKGMGSCIFSLLCCLSSCPHPSH